MDNVKRLLDRIRLICLNGKAKFDNIINTAFPETYKKYAFLAIVCVLEILLFYLILYFDIGIWNSTGSISEMIALYWLQQRSFPLLFVLGAMAALFIGILAYVVVVMNENTGRGFSLSESNIYGNAREINTEELNEVAIVVPKEAAMNTILGQVGTDETQLITMRPNRHRNNNILVLGSPGSGKTFNFSINFLFQVIRRRESCICVDTKGDLWSQTVEFARLHGYTIRRIDFKDPIFSDGWNILSELRHDDNRAATIAQIIMENSGNEKDPHFAAEQELLRALLIYTERAEGIADEERNLYYAITLLNRGVTELDLIFSKCQFEPDLIAAYDAYVSFKSGSPNLRGNIIANLFGRISIITSPPVKHLISYTDVDLTLPAKQPCIYYCNMSDQHETMKFMGNLFFSLAFLDLVEFADRQKEKHCPVRVNMLIEEMINLGKIPNLRKYLNTCRSRWVDIQLCVQNIGDMEDLYGEKMAHSIMSACATHLVYGFNDRLTSEHFEWRAGEATVDTKTEQHYIGESPLPIGRRYSTGFGRRQYFTSNQLTKLKAGKCLIVWQRYDTMEADTFGMNRNLAVLTGEVNEITSEMKIPLSDTDSRKFIRQKEKERIDIYNTWIRNGGNPWPSPYTEPIYKGKGSASGTQIPAIIPYPELEDLALAQSSTTQQEAQDALMKRLTKEKPIPQDEDDLIDPPDDFEWFNYVDPTVPASPVTEEPAASPQRTQDPQEEPKSKQPQKTASGEKTTQPRKRPSKKSITLDSNFTDLGPPNPNLAYMYGADEEIVQLEESPEQPSEDTQPANAIRHSKLDDF